MRRDGTERRKKKRKRNDYHVESDSDKLSDNSKGGVTMEAKRGKEDYEDYQYADARESYKKHKSKHRGRFDHTSKSSYHSSQSTSPGKRRREISPGPKRSRPAAIEKIPGYEDYQYADSSYSYKRQKSRDVKHHNHRGRFDRTSKSSYHSSQSTSPDIRRREISPGPKRSAEDVVERIPNHKEYQYADSKVRFQREKYRGDSRNAKDHNHKRRRNSSQYSYRKLDDQKQCDVSPRAHKKPPDAEGEKSPESITISDIERSILLEGRVVGKRVKGQKKDERMLERMYYLDVQTIGMKASKNTETWKYDQMHVYQNSCPIRSGDRYNPTKYAPVEEQPRPAIFTDRYIASSCNNEEDYIH